MQEIFGKVNKIFSYYEKYGSSDYIGEPVTQIEHMTQGAMFAELDHQKPEIVIAMFLHDIGHLLVEDNPELMGDLGVANHEKIGRKFLEDLGVPYPIPNLVENHVKVKRYLVAINPSYYEKLSDASKKTLEYQGGPMNKDEVQEFVKDPLFKDSLLVRSYDEKSKVKDMKIKSLEYYKNYIIRFLLLQ